MALWAVGSVAYFYLLTFVFYLLFLPTVAEALAGGVENIGVEPMTSTVQA